ncbi:hypothetical protein [Kordiimonas aestuarii]|uniref:hypothetical protein n=1 Tax=Kordiimonas aestuarii TaxID=1005925 RepID=UPI0021D37346|nr:hypothetical protein [Kordiimonas aestuarii]
MKILGWRLLFAALLVGGAVWFAFRLPDAPTCVVTVEVIALDDGTDGWRSITVRFPDGRVEKIETLTPFFFRPGDTAQVGVFERYLLPNHYDIVVESSVED